MTEDAGNRSSWRIVLGLVLLTVVLRGAHLACVARSPLFTYHRTFWASDMYLNDQWAQRILAGDLLGRESYQPVVNWQLAAAPREVWQRWYGHPLAFYKAPFYAYLVAALYWLFGDAMLPLALLQIGVAALCVVLLVRIGSRLFTPAAGVLAGLLFATYGPAIHYDVTMLRGCWILLVSLLVTEQLIALRLTPTARAAGVLGLTVGIALIVNEGFLLILPLVLALFLWWFRSVRQGAVLGGAFLAGVTLGLAPVLLRNVALGVPPLQLFVSSNVGIALFNASDSSPYFVNIPSSLRRTLEAGGGRFLGTLWASWSSFPSVASLVLFYLRKSAGVIVPFEVPENVNYYYAAVRCPLLGLLPTYAVLFPLGVVGLVLAMRRPSRLEPLLPVTLCLLLALITLVAASRYRVTLAVYLMLPAGLALAEAYGGLRRRRFAPVAASGAAVLVIWLATGALERQLVFGGEAPGGFRYRSTEFLLNADILAREGRDDEAFAEVLELILHNPNTEVRSGALRFVAQLQLDKRDEAATRAFLAQSAQAAGGDAGFLMTVGDFYRERLRDYAGARAVYHGALALHPSAATDRALRRRLAPLEGSPPSATP